MNINDYKYGIFYKVGNKWKWYQRSLLSKFDIVWDSGVDEYNCNYWSVPFKKHVNGYLSLIRKQLHKKVKLMEYKPTWKNL